MRDAERRRNWLREWEENRRRDSQQAYAALMKFYPFTLENLDGEQWVDIPNYEGQYQVSTFGRVKSFAHSAEKVLKPTINRQGYLSIHLCKNGRARWFRVSRLVALCFLPNPENKPEVDHRYGMKLDNYVDNLRWATSSENINYAFDLGIQRGAQGDLNYAAKLTNAQAHQIRENPDDLTCSELAVKFGINEQLVSAIQLGRRYKNAGGKIRSPRGVPAEIRKKIRTEYVFGSSVAGSKALARKYGVDQKTILNILKEK